ncbi:MAG: hypothetical protein PHG97_02600 [Candidatus Margulisbacteria bacterium]|nr:hypothetical protein [Candidatus Margulisiibacteriota bacterium]
MKLDEKIQDRKVAYLFRKHPAIAFELVLLHFVSAKRKQAKAQIVEAVKKAIYWLKKAGVEVPEYLERLSPAGRLEEIEKILVSNKTMIEVPEYLKQFRPFGQFKEIEKILVCG